MVKELVNNSKTHFICTPGKNTESLTLLSYTDVVLDQMFKCYSMYIFFPSSKAEVK